MKNQASVVPGAPSTTARRTARTRRRQAAAAINTPALRLAAASNPPVTRLQPPHLYLTSGRRSSQGPGCFSYDSGGNETDWRNGLFSRRLRVPCSPSRFPAPLYGPLPHVYNRAVRPRPVLSWTKGSGAAHRQAKRSRKPHLTAGRTIEGGLPWSTSSLQ